MNTLFDRKLVIVFVAVIATTLAQPPVIGNLPLRYILKDRMELSATDVAAFFTIAAIPWYFKPLAGLLSDKVRIWGSRRRKYLLFSAAGASAMWFLLANSSHGYGSLLVWIAAINTVMMVGSASLGGVFVDYGKESKATGIASTVMQTARTIVGLLAGPLSGFLASVTFAYTCYVGGLLLATFFLLCYWLLHDAPSGHRETAVSNETRWSNFISVVFHPPMWIAAGMLALIFLTPGFVTPLWFHQVDTLKLSPQFIGNLSAIGSVCGLIGACFYGGTCRRLTLRQLLYVGVVADVVTTISFLWYDSRVAAIIITAVGGFVGVLTLVGLIDLAARSAPIGVEALGYALLMTAWNFSMSISDMLGSWMVDTFSMNFKGLVWLNALASAAVFPIVASLPGYLVDHADSRRE